MEALLVALKWLVLAAAFYLGACAILILLVAGVVTLVAAVAAPGRHQRGIRR